MLKKTALGIAAAAAITVTALSATTTGAQAAKFGFYFGGPGFSVGHGFHGGWGNPCRRWKRKFHRTGRYYYLRRYRRCMRWYY